MKNFSEYVNSLSCPEFTEFTEQEILNSCSSFGLNEVGDGASEVVWSTRNGAKIGTFVVTTPKSSGEFTIVIKTPSSNNQLFCKSLDIQEFKFYDENGNIEASNLMNYHIAVGPTIKREFKNFLKTDPEVVVFTANRYEESRVRHYDKNTTQIAKEMNYIPFFKTAFLKETKEYAYALVRPDKLKEFKKCFGCTNL